MWDKQQEGLTGDGIDLVADLWVLVVEGGARTEGLLTSNVSHGGGSDERMGSCSARP